MQRWQRSNYTGKVENLSTLTPSAQGFECNLTFAGVEFLHCNSRVYGYYREGHIAIWILPLMTTCVALQLYSLIYRRHFNVFHFYFRVQRTILHILGLGICNVLWGTLWRKWVLDGKLSIDWLYKCWTLKCLFRDSVAETFRVQKGFSASKSRNKHCSRGTTFYNTPSIFDPL